MGVTHWEKPAGTVTGCRGFGRGNGVAVVADPAAPARTTGICGMPAGGIYRKRDDGGNISGNQTAAERRLVDIA